MKEKRWPVRILTGSGDVDTVLSYYGLARQSIESAGGHIGNGNDPEERKNFDVVGRRSTSRYIPARRGTTENART